MDLSVAIGKRNIFSHIRFNPANIARSHEYCTVSIVSLLVSVNRELLLSPTVLPLSEMLHPVIKAERQRSVPGIDMSPPSSFRDRPDRHRLCHALRYLQTGRTSR